MPELRVLLADDHAVVREGLRTFLDLQDGIEVAGEAADGRQAVDEAERLRPDVVLMDLVMPRLDGVEAMQELRSRVPGARVVVLTSFLDEEATTPQAPARPLPMAQAPPEPVSVMHPVGEGGTESTPFLLRLNVEKPASEVTPSHLPFGEKRGAVSSLALSGISVTRRTWVPSFRIR